MLLRFIEKQINALDVEQGSPRRAEILGDAARVLDGARLVTRGANTGPGGNAGTVVCGYDDELSDEQYKRIGYYPAKQEWVDCGGYWCGTYKGERVTPASIARNARDEGALIELGDGQQWRIPQALYGFGDGETVMPRKLRLVNGVTVLGAVVDEFADYDAQARAFWREWTTAIDEGRNARYPFDGLVSLVAAGLAVNYRLTAAEAANVLGLFDQRNIWEAAKATIGWPTVEEMLKSISDAEKKNPEAPIPK